VVQVGDRRHLVVAPVAPITQVADVASDQGFDIDKVIDTAFQHGGFGFGGTHSQDGDQLFPLVFLLKLADRVDALSVIAVVFHNN